ncbi:MULTISPECIES: hypothetical protein [unclassified Avibacterium]|uniref:hypothetical protein n=1 Tax=unclassified Avibacterium TaxID=2685287 RepID=UPI0020273F34|nr:MULTISPECIES: hypothetical protein [unclassified Avibacterium]URL02839.1 hypothetical protein L4F91_04410 [Avibacterium sp. 20-126]MCW9698272.1 hypothetical protein [Avibacterium sp. 20-129]MCW9718440.1 hypothetical protein [Avibacterium sp. 21-599]MCW9732039.1 hypothetical protein [Avibacterium sp. 20-15]URL04219.1 hypothetical protein L4F93_11900 [Avibacterium sp. 20-132]
MATEKLTKKRLIQIILMLCILLSAFFYRTCHYQQIQSAVENQQILDKEKASE